jgi:hypothetical protein
VKLLVVNANTSEFVTARVARGTHPAARPGTEIEVDAALGAMFPAP